MAGELRLGAYQDVLQDVTCDALITDPPFGKRTHTGHDSAARQVLSLTGQKTRRSLVYQHWVAADVREFVEFWSARTRGWMFCMTSDDLIGAYRDAFEDAGRCHFAPVGLLMYHPRLLGDGPGSGLVYCMVSRPRSRKFVGGWSNPPWYGPVTPERKSAQHIGGKPVSVMRRIVCDYSRAGDVVCDPCAGFASTGVAALETGREFVGAELDRGTYAAALDRLQKPTGSADLFATVPRRPKQLVASFGSATDAGSGGAE